MDYWKLEDENVGHVK